MSQADEVGAVMNGKAHGGPWAASSEQEGTIRLEVMHAGRRGREGRHRVAAGGWRGCRKEAAGAGRRC